MKVKKGQSFWCLHPRLSEPEKGTIIALTNNPAKMIGMEFKKAVGLHSCDGRGADSSCLWVLPKHIVTDEKYEQIKKDRAVSIKHAEQLIGEDVQELDLSSDK